MRYIIFDRDGTLIKHIPYLHDKSQVELNPGARSIIKEFIKEGYQLFLHTNQSGVARGLFKIDDVIECNDRMIELLDIPKPIFNKICIATDYPSSDNSYRKPSPRFGLELIKEYNIKSNELIYIGDSVSDLLTAKKLSCMAYGVDSEGNNELNHEISNIPGLKKIKVFNSLNEIKTEIINQDN